MALSRMPRRLVLPLVALAVASLLASPLAEGAKRKSRRKRGATASHSAKARPTPGPYYGPPAPTPVPLLRAAGACTDFEPDLFLVLSEVGSVGRLFRIDKETEISTPISRATRVRILYFEGPDGPVARKILPGPVEDAAAVPTRPATGP